MGIQETVFLAADVDVVSAGILGLVFIALIVFCVLARNTWNWLDISFLILSFIAGTAAIWGATSVYKQRSVQLRAVADAEERLIKQTLLADEQESGKATSLTYDPGSLRAVTGELAREMVGRGRVWANGQLAADGNNRVFTFATARPDVVNRPLRNVVVYVFSDNLYVGSVRVVAETEANVTLEAVALAETVLFDKPNGSWTLFEKMPLDRRGSLKAASLELLRKQQNLQGNALKLKTNLEDPTADLDIALFREFIQTYFLKPDLLGLPVDSIEYEKIVDNYAFDGLSLGRITNWIQDNPGSRKSGQFEPKPEEVFIKYKFQVKSSRKYAVDANGSVENDGLFTPLGLAVDDAIKAGKEVEFAVNDTVLVDQRTANGYQRSSEVTIPAFTTTETVEKVDEIFIRQVRDFPYEFADLREQAQKTGLEAIRVARTNAVQTKSLKDSQAQFDARAVIIANLEADQEALKTDFAEIERLYGDKSEENTALKQKIELLETKIDEAYDRIRALSIGLARRAFAGR